MFFPTVKFSVLGSLRQFWLGGSRVIVERLSDESREEPLGQGLKFMLSRIYLAFPQHDQITLSHRIILLITDTSAV